MGYELFLEFTDDNDVNLLNNFDENKFKTDIIIKKENGEVLKGGYNIIQNRNKKILRINTSDFPNNKVHVITYSIQNKELLGSTDKFYLTTKWVFSNNRNTLIELSRNGIQIAPIKEDYYSYYSLKRK